ncbi:MAG TPA: response regulator transcription factor [Bacteroidales bacterium]|nr:response regulator transcription factor [Bacteroidales bacterium]
MKKEHSSVLIIEDDPRVALIIQRGLESIGIASDVALDGEIGLKYFSSRLYHLIILDIGLPDMSGYQVCREIRLLNKDIPVLFLTALSDLDRKLEGFDAGADDYIVKPFEIQELLARVFVFLRRAHGKQNDSEFDELLKFSDLELNMKTKTAFRGGKEIILTQKEFLLLEQLMRNPNRVISKSEIAEKVWDITFDTG